MEKIFVKYRICYVFQEITWCISFTFPSRYIYTCLPISYKKNSYKFPSRNFPRSFLRTTVVLLDNSFVIQDNPKFGRCIYGSSDIGKYFSCYRQKRLVFIDRVKICERLRKKNETFVEKRWMKSRSMNSTKQLAQFWNILHNKVQVSYYLLQSR